MTDLVIRRTCEADERIGDFIHEGFSRYGEQCEVTLHYDAFCFVAEDREGKLIGALTGRAYYNEVHVGDLIVAEGSRGRGVGSSLVRSVEAAYQGRGYDVMTLSTFGFQAPEFYKKLGFTLEFVRENADPKLSKYFLRKELSSSASPSLPGGHAGSADV